jgi:RsiW-degrading membrane proteinase PrsW (M82 family)
MILGFILCSVSALFWMPLLIRFYRSWRARENPVSLGICAAITLIMWMLISLIWLVMDDVNAPTIVTSNALMSMFVAGYVYIAFAWSKRKFPDARSKPPAASE